MHLYCLSFQLGYSFVNFGFAHARGSSFAFLNQGTSGRHGLLLPEGLPDVTSVIVGNLLALRTVWFIKRIEFQVEGKDQPHAYIDETLWMGAFWEVWGQCWDHGSFCGFYYFHSFRHGKLVWYYPFFENSFTDGRNRECWLLLAQIEFGNQLWVRCCGL